MSNGLKIAKEVTMAEVRQRARPYRMAFYGAITPWWTSSERDLYTMPGIGLPCDPRGGVLFQTEEGDLDKFLKSAEANPENYGKHGIRAFLAAYQGVVVTAEGKPTCCNNWDGYNGLLDAKDAEQPARTPEMPKAWATSDPEGHMQAYADACADAEQSAEKGPVSE